MVEVKVIDKTDRGIRLSRKPLLEKPEGYVEPAPRPPRSDRGDRRSRDNNRRPSRGNDNKGDKPMKSPQLIPPPKTTVGG